MQGLSAPRSSWGWAYGRQAPIVQEDDPYQRGVSCISGDPTDSPRIHEGGRTRAPEGVWVGNIKASKGQGLETGPQFQ